VLFNVIDKAEEKRARVYKRVTSILDRMKTVEVRSPFIRRLGKRDPVIEYLGKTGMRLEAVNGVHKHMEGAGELS
jgi:hypothetical protein